jgi:hypothetical protein
MEKRILQQIMNQGQNLKMNIDKELSGNCDYVFGKDGRY